MVAMPRKRSVFTIQTQSRCDETTKKTVRSLTTQPIQLDRLSRVYTDRPYNLAFDTSNAAV